MFGKELEQRVGVIVAISALLVLFSFGLTSGHSPSSMVLEYDTEAGELTVNITHVVADLETHFVEFIEVEIDGVPVMNETYAAQPRFDIFEYIYELDAEEGSTISVTAYCNQVGSVSASLDVGVDDEVEVPEEEDTPGFTFMLLSLGIVFSALVYGKRRYP